jgi:hypothetical protein
MNHDAEVLEQDVRPIREMEKNNELSTIENHAGNMKCKSLTALPSFD